MAALGCMLVAGACATTDGVGPTDTTTECAGGADVCESTPSVDDVRELAASLGSEGFAQAMVRVYEPLTALGEGCEGFAGWAEDVSVVSELLDEAGGLAQPVDPAHSERMADADRLARWVEDTLVLASACVDAKAELDTALAASAGAIGAADRFRFALTGYQNTSLGSRFWSFYEQPGHVVEAVRLVEEHDNIDILLTGDSSMKWAFDPLSLSESTGETAVNFSADGLPATLFQHWIDDLEAIGVAPRAVVIGVSSWGTLISCSDQRIDAYAAASRSRSASFGLVDSLAEIDPMVRDSGGEAGRYQSPLMDRFDNANVPEGRGLVKRDETVTPEGDESWLNGPYVRQFAQPQPCEDNAEAIGELAVELSEGGVELYVVAMPLSEEMTSLHPDGRAGHLDLVQGYREAIEGTDAVFVDFTDVLEADGFWDLVHANDSGRRRLTAELSKVVDAD